MTDDEIEGRLAALEGMVSTLLGELSHERLRQLHYLVETLHQRREEHQAPPDAQGHMVFAQLRILADALRLPVPKWRARPPKRGR